MRRRRGITLIEVLVAIFIMAIGLLAILTLFPLGAMRMGQALQDDRTAASASAGANYCDCFNVRNDLSFFNAANGTNLYTNPGAALGIATPAAQNGSGYPLYVDPWGVNISGLAAPVGGVIPRVVPSVYPAPYNTPLSMGVRYFSLPDDMTFYDNGAPDTSNGNIQRGGRYTWAYLLHRSQPASTTSSVDLTVVVYAARATSTVGENSFAPNPVAAANQTNITLTWGAVQPPNIVRGSWILDTSIDTDPTSGVLLGVHGLFYRVVSVSLPASNVMNLEVQVPLVKPVTQVTVLDNVVDVFSRGTDDSTHWEFRNEQ